MTDIDPESYYNAAGQLADTSRKTESNLRDLDKKLAVANSAGSYAPGGTTWGQNYDQAASDIFEVASTSAMAARELAYQIHQAGLNHANAENHNNPAAGQPTPAPPQGTSLEINLHPTNYAAGGLEDTPEHWDLIVGLVVHPWADSDPTRITQAGTDFGDWGRSTKTNADSMKSSALVKWTDEEKKDPEVSGIIDEINNVHFALHDSGELATYLETSCKAVGAISDANRNDIKTSLQILYLISLSYEADRLAAQKLPKFLQRYLESAIDKLDDATKTAYAAQIDAALQEINDKITEAIGNCQGIYSAATGDVQFLSSILDRTPRNANPIRNRDDSDNQDAGRDGERRAGIPDGYTKKRVDIAGQSIYPDYVDDVNHQVIEVKNANKLDARSIDQIKLETAYAQSEGYSMILVTDHRTQINDSDIQHMIDTGQIQLVRKELDDNDDH